MCANAGKLA